MATPFVTINLDKERELRLTMKAMIEFEKTNKVKLMDIANELSIEVCAKLAYTMLKQNDADLTLDKTLDLLDKYMLPGEAIEKITEALTAAFPTAKNAKKPAVK